MISVACERPIPFTTARPDSRVLQRGGLVRASGFATDLMERTRRMKYNLNVNANRRANNADEPTMRIQKRYVS